MKMESRLGENMQPAQATSPWPKRILIAGAVLSVCGIVSFVLISGPLAEVSDPREISEHTVENEIDTITLEEGCWVVHVEGSDSDYDVSFNYVEDGAEADSVDDDCKTDFQTIDNEVEFSTITTLNIEDESEILITTECEEEDGCENPLLFTNGNEAAMNQLEILLIPGGLCGVGFLLIPLGWVLISINRGRENKVGIVQNQIISATPLEETPQMNQDMLTTDQLYKLMRGEVPTVEQQNQNVPSPFVDVDTRIRKMPDTKVGGSINKASIHTPENPPTDESWKNWDEG